MDFIGGYNPRPENIPYFLSHVSKGLDKYQCNYDNILILGDIILTNQVNSFYNSTFIETGLSDHRKRR